MRDECHTKKCVLIFTRKESPFFRRIAACLLERSKRLNWAVHVISLGDARAPVPRMTTAIETWKPDGVIAYCAQPAGVPPASVSARVPTVYVNASRDALVAPNIRHDSTATGHLAAREFIRLGLDNFAFFAENPALEWVRLRQKRYTQEINRLGRIVHVGTDATVAWLKSLPKPCGLFAANDLSAERILATAKRAGILIPDELAVIGVDDDERICEHAEVSISSIRPDAESCGQMVVEALSALMSGIRKSDVKSRSYADEGLTRRTSTRIITHTHAPAIEAALEHIRRNALSGISSSDVLTLFGKSRRAAETAFRNAVGHSILQEITAVRLAEAQRLLSRPLIDIGSIASRVGYKSQNHLARIFKRETGLTMREWRAQLPNRRTSE